MDFIKLLQIKNFKSIKDLTLPCSRINIFIGKPNVGKSNILEALDVTYLSWMFNQNLTRQRENINAISLNEFFRVNKVADLFYFANLREEIELNFFNEPPITLSYREEKEGGGVYTLHAHKSGIYTEFDNNFNPIVDTHFFSSPIVPYKYKEDIQYHNSGNYLLHLMPPHGNNINEFIKYNPSFRDFIDEIISRRDMELNIDEALNTMSIQLRKGENLIYTLPYKAMADTLKRMIFYFAAIESNQYIITLEEPEVHSFPPFVSRLADKIIETKETQFFIATHSTVLLTNLIENTPKDELAVFVCDYDDKNHQTTATPLSEGQLSEALVYGVDMFFNINHFLDDPIEHTS